MDRSAWGQSSRPDVDYYVLALSWSPSFCETHQGGGERLQCGGDADFHFVVHGLWPSNDARRLQYCESNHANPTRREVDAMLDIMPSASLVRYQWRKHGRCSGRSPRRYFQFVRQAFERITIPPGLTSMERGLDARPSVVREAFRRANPGLDEDDIYLRCTGGQLTEVRICLDADLDFRSCSDVGRNRCRARLIDIPAPR
ncbi:ribonuclease T2 [Acuticoccus sp. M5D2P5]|uniref:ribonuclease T2 n=1 Tax=Acuticoccus kalidii TaxID=2910977 RepID=UPI001F2B5A25|nr:ribonuclease T2 [Acuticoccus kalidii]MCF3932282.1 ribonuclease T2 [Acuticoccus kalidii]